QGACARTFRENKVRDPDLPCQFVATNFPRTTLGEGEVGNIAQNGQLFLAATDQEENANYEKTFHAGRLVIRIAAVNVAAPNAIDTIRDDGSEGRPIIDAASDP